MAKKRAKYRPDGKGKWDGENLTQMRDVAFGRDMNVFLHRVERKQESRDDQFTQDQAQLKRDRKAAKIRKLLAQQEEK